MFHAFPAPRRGLRRGVPSFALALALGLAPAPSFAAAFEAPARATGDPHHIRLDASVERFAAASAFDADRLLAERAPWFETQARAPLAAPARLDRSLVLEDPKEILRHAEGGQSLLGWTFERGATVVDAWLLLAVPFLLPVVLRRRPRRRSRSGSLRASRRGSDPLGRDPRGMGLTPHAYPASSVPIS